MAADPLGFAALSQLIALLQPNSNTWQLVMDPLFSSSPIFPLRYSLYFVSDAPELPIYFFSFVVCSDIVSLYPLSNSSPVIIFTPDNLLERIEADWLSQVECVLFSISCVSGNLVRRLVSLPLTSDIATPFKEATEQLMNFLFSERMPSHAYVIEQALE